MAVLLQGASRFLPEPDLCAHQPLVWPLYMVKESFVSSTVAWYLTLFESGMGGIDKNGSQAYLESDTFNDKNGLHPGSIELLGFSPCLEGS